MTPEGKIKAQIKALLESVPDLYYEMYVPSGYGKSGLDFTCCWRGHALYIEAKKSPEDTLRPRQRGVAVRMLVAGGSVFIVAGPDGLSALRTWFRRHGAVV